MTSWRFGDKWRFVKAARILMNAGFKNVSDYKNGIAEWKEENLPLGKSE